MKGIQILITVTSVGTSKLDALWQMYDVADTDEEAMAAFIARYDREPSEVWRDGGCVHAGPITKEEHDGKVAGPESV